MTLFKRLFAEDDGEVSVEWAILVAFLAIALAVGATTMAGKINNAYTNLGDRVNTCITAGTTSPC